MKTRCIVATFSPSAGIDPGTSDGFCDPRLTAAMTAMCKQPHRHTPQPHMCGRRSSRWNGADIVAAAVQPIGQVDQAHPRVTRGSGITRLYGNPPEPRASALLAVEALARGGLARRERICRSGAALLQVLVRLRFLLFFVATHLTLGHDALLPTG